MFVPGIGSITFHIKEQNSRNVNICQIQDKIELWMAIVAPGVVVPPKQRLIWSSGGASGTLS